MLLSIAAFSVAVFALVCLPAMLYASAEEGASVPQDLLDLTIVRAPASGSACWNFTLDTGSPLKPLSSPVCAATFSATVSKVLDSVPEGAPKDTLALGIRVEDPEGRSCWLICSASPSQPPAHRGSALLGDYFLCGTNKGMNDLPGDPAKASVVIWFPDFFPALALAARAGRISADLPSLRIGSIYPFSETSVCSEDAAVICANLKSSARFELSSISVDGEELAFVGNCACVPPSTGSHDVSVSGVSYAALFPARITQTFYGLRL